MSIIVKCFSTSRKQKSRRNMGKSLDKIAEDLKNAKNITSGSAASESDVKVQLIYAFNGAGKTRLSREFKLLVDPKIVDDEQATSFAKVIYYNAFTEDLFYWFNDLDNDLERELRTQPNGFTTWLVKFLQDQGLDQRISDNFQLYASEKLIPTIEPDFSRITFSFKDNSGDTIPNVKISKGEESNFIWSVFYSLLVQIVEERNIPDVSNRSTADFNDLEYIFIDDPVSSLDENHLMELAVDLAKLIKASKSGLKFIISTHSPLFYNVLHNEFKKPKFKKYILTKLENGEVELLPQSDDSPFSYQLFLKKEIEKALQSGNIQKYHFNFMRNILEKSSTFLGYSDWKELLPSERKDFHSRIIDISSHSKHSSDEIAIPTQKDIDDIKFLIDNTQILKLFK